jgi:hypothetical protein
LSHSQVQRIARAARERALAEHTADHRAAELEELLGQASLSAQPQIMETEA